MNHLSEVLTRIAEEHKDQLRPDSRFYREISIGRTAGRLGLDDLKQAYKGVSPSCRSNARRRG